MKEASNHRIGRGRFHRKEGINLEEIRGVQISREKKGVNDTEKGKKGGGIEGRLTWKKWDGTI